MIESKSTAIFLANEIKRVLKNKKNVMNEQSSALIELNYLIIRHIREMNEMHKKIIRYYNLRESQAFQTRIFIDRLIELKKNKKFKSLDIDIFCNMPPRLCEYLNEKNQKDFERAVVMAMKNFDKFFKEVKKKHDKTN